MIRRDSRPPKSTKAAARNAGKKLRAQKISDVLAELNRLEAASPKSAAMIELFRDWLTDESGYDEQTWPKLKSALNRERARIGARELFDA